MVDPAVAIHGEEGVTIGTGAVLDAGDPDHHLVFVTAATALTVEGEVVPVVVVVVVDGRAIFMFRGVTHRGVAVAGAITDVAHPDPGRAPDLEHALRRLDRPRPGPFRAPLVSKGANGLLLGHPAPLAGVVGDRGHVPQ